MISSWLLTKIAWWLNLVSYNTVQFMMPIGLELYEFGILFLRFHVAIIMGYFKWILPREE